MRHSLHEKQRAREKKRSQALISMPLPLIFISMAPRAPVYFRRRPLSSLPRRRHASMPLAAADADGARRHLATMMPIESTLRHFGFDIDTRVCLLRACLGALRRQQRV